AAQSAEQGMATSRAYSDQGVQILDSARSEGVDNASGLGPRTLADGLRYTRRLTGAQLLGRAGCARRFAAGRPIPVSEGWSQLAAAMQPRDVAEVERAVAAGGRGANQAKRSVAHAVVALYHGAAEAAGAEERFDATFRRHEVPQDAEPVQLPDGDPVHLPAVL